MRRLLFLLPLALLAGCPRPAVSPPPAVPAPTPSASPTPTPPPSAPPQSSPTTQSSPDTPSTQDPEAWATYQGAWFSVQYPQGFRVVPREKSKTSTSGYDGVSFTSPDGRVEFYVFSPQWNGESEWARLQPDETEEDRSSSKSGDTTAEQVTVRGAGGRYTRSWVDVTNPTLNTRHVFGYKYKNAAAYADFKPLYLEFKDSLAQTAD